MISRASKLYLSGIEMWALLRMPIRSQISKLYLSGIEIDFRMYISVTLIDSKLYLSGIEIKPICRVDLKLTALQIVP